MSKLIKINKEDMEACVREFEESLKKSTLTGGKFTFTKDFGKIERKATLYFSEEAWFKMKALVEKFESEVGWHGLARRGDDETKDEYFVDDIIMYPQEVTGATVNTDQSEYNEWLMGNPDDVFNNIRMQGHSHVRMGVTPSAVDDAYYESLLEKLDDDMFYIFMILNKQGNKTIMIYDFKKNILFETADIEVIIRYTEGGLQDFLNISEDMVKTKKVVNTYQKPKTNTNSYPSYYGSTYSDYYDDYYGRNGYSTSGSYNENKYRKGYR